VTAGVGSLTPIAKVAATSSILDELLSAFLELEAMLRILTALICLLIVLSSQITSKKLAS
jgi:hypothetical protein